MARLVLVSFKDNDAAEAFCKLVDQSDDVHKEGWGDHVAELGTLLSAYGRLEWMIARPLAWCKCHGHSKNRQWGWARTRRFGWWIHATCNKCSKLTVINFVTNLLAGYNDLLPELRPKPEPVAEETPGGVGKEVEGVPPQPAVLAGVQEQSPQGALSAERVS
jgi:hypothetical protein